MTVRSKALLKGALFLAATLPLFGAPGCDQPRVACVTGRGDFAAKYTLRSGTGACAGMKGEVVGVQSYNASNGDRPDLEKISVALRAVSLGDLVQHAEDQALTDTTPGHQPYALGAFSTPVPGGDDFCAVPTLAPAQQDLPLVPAIPPDPTVPNDPGTPEQPATSVKYAWSDVRVYVTAAATGTQFAAELEYTQDGCTAQYHVVAVYPAVSCADADGKPSSALCSPDADPDAGIAVGSGINPDFPVVCDPDLLLCVLTGEPPALR